MPRDPLFDVAHLPLEDVGPLTPEKWARIEAYLEDWKREVLAAAERHPARSYELGSAQVKAFAELLGNLGSEVSPFGGTGESARQTLKWSRTYLTRELEDALTAYIGKIKDELLYGLRLQINPTQVASRLYNATHDATVNWRMIARTEMVRANAMGRLAAARKMGYDRVWVPPHAGACKRCRALLENRVFLIADVERASNFGVKDPEQWVPCIPLHPQCRHGYLPYDEEVYGEAMRQYDRMRGAGLMDDDNLDEWFDSSGQLKPEYAGIDFSAAKSIITKDEARNVNLDLWVEGLAAVVHKRRDALYGSTRTPRREHVPLARLQVASYQRPIDWPKVTAFARRLRDGEDIPELDVAERADGSLWVEDGQHRLLASARVGEPTIACAIRRSLGWADEADRCRELMKAIADPLLTNPQPLGIPMARIEAPAPEHLAAGLTAAVWDRQGPRREVLDQLDQWWARTVGQDVVAASRLYLTPWPDTVHVAVDWQRLRTERPAWRKLADGDMHAALIAMAIAGARDAELAPGIPLVVAVRPEHSIDAFEHGLADAGLQAWSVDGTGFVGRHGGRLDVATALRDRAEKSIDLADLWPGYVFKAASTALGSGERNASFEPLSLATADRLVDSDDYAAPRILAPEVAKSPAAAEPNSGVEHWITVHPHGEDEKGTPVLVRNNSDGSMTVIGGAGGNLRYLRIDPRRRISEKESGSRTKAAGKPERILSAEEQARAKWDLAQARRQATKTIETSEQRLSDLQDQLRQYVESEVGAKWLTHGLIRHADGSTEEYELGFMEQRQAMRKLTQGALQTLAVGELDGKDAQDAPYLFEQRQGDFEGMPDADKADETIKGEAENGETMEPDAPAAESDTTGEQDLAAAERKINRRLPPLTTEQAEQVMRLERQIAKVRRERAKAKKVLKGEADIKSALALEWADGDIDDAVRKRVEEEQRTLAARDLLDTTDRNTYRVNYARGLHFGALATLDSFTSTVLGSSAVTPEIARLLGPEGTAQLIAHVIRQKAIAVGDPDKLDLAKPLAALERLSDQLEADVAQKATARARRAMDVAVSMKAERKKSERGESLWTKSMSQGYEREKFNEASGQLGQAIGAFEAVSALKVALERPPKELVVSGLESPSAVMALAQRAGLQVKPENIERKGDGDYTLRLPMEVAAKKLAKLDRPPDWDRRQLLKRIRTGKGMTREIEAARDTPGMAQRLSPAQAQGKMFLLASDDPGTKRHWNLTGTPIEKKSEDLRAQLQLGTVLDFAPGVGKTHTAIAAAMQLMHDEPEMHHRVLVTAPATALGPWVATIQRQSYRSVAGENGEENLEPIQGPTVAAPGYRINTKSPTEVELKGSSSRAARDEMLANPPDFVVVSHDSLQRDPDLAKKLGCTIVVTDETQKFKNERNKRSRALSHAGTEVGVARPKVMSRTRWEATVKDLEKGYGFISRADAVRSFREGLDDRLFHMDASTAGNDLPGAEKGDKDSIERLGFPHTRHKVEIPDELRTELGEKVQWINQTHAQLLAEQRGGLRMGGQPILAKMLFDRPGNPFAVAAADLMAERLAKPIEWAGFKGHPKHADGENAGTYDRKGIVFSQFSNTQLKHVIPELEQRGLKVFYAHGELSADENDKMLASFLAFKGKAVLVTTDKNSTARSLQFGDNNGTFQHGATEMLHYTLPDNNATIQQRNARILRRGAQVKCAYHTLFAGTPAEQRQEDRLQRELRTQAIAGNSEGLVEGQETLRSQLASQGVAPANELHDKAPPDDDEQEDDRAA